MAMALPTLPKPLGRAAKASEKRSKAVTIRLTERSYKQLVALSDRTGLSQADVITLLLEQEHSDKPTRR